MISKSSFLASMKENFKRRGWTAGLSAIAFFLYYPIGLTVFLQAQKQQAKTETEMRHLLTGAWKEYLQFNEPILILTLCLALFLSIQGFSYLYSRKKVDLYHSVPVSRKKRLLVIYLNGLLIYLAANVTALLLGIAVIAVFGGLTASVFAVAGSALLYSLLFFLCVYHIGILAVMLTGNLLTGILAAGVFLIYEEVIELLWRGMHSIFFDSYTSFGAEGSSWLSPFGLSIGLLREMEDGADTILICFKLLLAAAAFGTAAFLCGLKRPSEAAGAGMAFQKSKLLIKLFILIPASLCAGAVFYAWSNQSHGLFLLGMLLGTVLGHALIEFLYERDFSAGLHRKKQLLFAVILSGSIYVVFAADLFQYDAYLPKQEEVEYAGIYLENNNYESTFDEFGKSVGKADYQLSRMKLADWEPVRKLAENWIGSGKEMAEVNRSDYQMAYIKYRLSSGKDVYRCIGIEKEKEANREQLNLIFQQPAYYEQTYQIFNGFYFQDLLNMTLFFDNGFGVKELPKEKLGVLIEALRKDLANQTYTDLYTQVPAGAVIFTSLIEEDSISYGRMEVSWPYPVYPSHQNTLRCLKEMGISANFQIKAEEVEKIEVFDYSEKRMEELKFASSKEGYLAAVIVDQDEIAKLLPKLLPDSLQSYIYNGSDYGNNLSIHIYRKGIQSSTGFIEDTKDNADVCIIADSEIPDFLKQALEQ